jgi:acetyl-CoA carboxylase biotin carboxyl carrier protein
MARLKSLKGSLMHDIRAEMVASVHSIIIEVGQHIAAGDTLMILESMKMEIPVLAEIAGSIVEIGVQVGDVVQEGDLLVMLAAVDGKSDAI